MLYLVDNSFLLTTVKKFSKCEYMSEVIAKSFLKHSVHILHAYQKCQPASWALKMSNNIFITVRRSLKLEQKYKHVF